MGGDASVRSEAGRWQRLAPGLAAAGLAILVYAATLGHASAYDDSFILRSPLLRHPWNLVEVFSNGFYSRPDRRLDLYRPLGSWSLVLNAVLARTLTGKLDAWAVFHAVNILLHAASSFLVFVWLGRLPMPRRVAGAAAILWAVLPVHAEVAANITARYESLAAVFGLGFLIAHRERRNGLSLALFGLGLLCKESVVTCLPLALAVDALFPVGARRFEPRRWIGPLGILCVWLAFRSRILAGETPAIPYIENPVASASHLVRAATASQVQLLYLRDQLAPFWLSTDHSFREILPVRTLADPFVIAFAALLVLASVVAWRCRTIRPEVTLCALGYAILFAPASNLLFPIGTIMADRLAYLPSIFTCLALALAIERIPSRAWARASVLVLAAFFGYRAEAQARPWKDDLTLFRRQVETAPESAKAHGNLGTALRDRGLFPESVAAYRTSLAIYPYRPEPNWGLAIALEMLGEDPELLVNTWADAVRFGTRGERPILQEALVAVELGDWPGLAGVRERMAAEYPEDYLIACVDGILRAARRLESLPRDGTVLRRADDLYQQGAWDAAESEYRRALHRGDVPRREIVRILGNMAVCSETVGRQARAGKLRELARASASD